MPLHPIYSRLTGATRLRRGWFGRLIMQVETADGGWREATGYDLKAISFQASSIKSRRQSGIWERYYPKGGYRMQWR